MSDYLLLNMKTYDVAGTFTNATAADESRDAAEGKFPSHLVKDRCWDELAATDLARIFNKLVPTAQRVVRFGDRVSAERRLNAALDGQNAEPGKDDKIWDAPDPAPRKKKEKKPKGERKARANTITKAILAPGGKKETLRFHEGSPRSKVFHVIKDEGEIDLVALVKRCSGFANKAQVLGCLQKLRHLNYIKTE